MVLPAAKLTPWAGGVTLLFPILLLCIPRGASVFIGAIALLALLAGRGLGQAWSMCRAELRPLGLAILAVLVVQLLSWSHFDLPWRQIDNPLRLALALLACLVVVAARPNAEGFWRGIDLALVIALAVVAFQRFALGVERPSAWIQAIPFANMVAVLGLVGFARPGVGRHTHLAAWASLMLAGAVLILNGTRGAWLAMWVLVPGLLYIRHPSMKPAKLFAAIAAILVVAGILYAGRINEAVTDIRQFQRDDVNTSIGGRLVLWGLAIDTFHAHPWLGIGAGQFNRAVNASRFCAGDSKPEVCDLGHVHNELLEAASTTGLPGFLARLGIFVVPAWLFARLRRIGRDAGNAEGERIALAGLAVVASSFISSLTQVILAHQASVVFYAGIIGLLLGLAVVQTTSPRAPAAQQA